jgi:hypothetical protein
VTTNDFSTWKNQSKNYRKSMGIIQLLQAISTEETDYNLKERKFWKSLEDNTNQDKIKEKRENYRTES